MHIKLIPLPGEGVANVRIEAHGLTVNGKTWSWDALPPEGAVRAEGGLVTIEYGERGGVGTCQLTPDHTVEIVPPDLPPPPLPEVDPVALARAELEVQRAGWVVDRWQIKTVLGRDLWAMIEAFGTGASAPWGLKTVIDDAVTIPRVSQTVDLLAYILGFGEEEVDDIFRRSMTLNA